MIIRSGGLSKQTQDQACEKIPRTGLARLLAVLSPAVRSRGALSPVARLPGALFHVAYAASAFSRTLSIAFTGTNQRCFRLLQRSRRRGQGYQHP
jgi:hypothetical protein